LRRKFIPLIDLSKPRYNRKRYLDMIVVMYLSSSSCWNVRRYTRTKTDLALREKELNFRYRAMDFEKQEFGITSDCTIQPESYRSMLCE
jgi:hypothetical protein